MKGNGVPFAIFVFPDDHEVEIFLIQTDALPEKVYKCVAARPSRIAEGDMTDAIDRIFAVSPDIRYVALYRNGALESHQRPGLENASAAESDKYEELIVNPTLLKCATQRGDIDCGGLRALVVAYGNFLELVIPIRGGHLSVGFENGSNPLAYTDQLAGMFDEQ